MMSPRKVHVITEGATERKVGDVLYKWGILSRHAQPQPPDWTSRFGQSREGYEQVIGEMQRQRVLEALRSSSQQERLLLVFDQEDAETPEDRAQKIGQDLSLSFHRIGDFTNLFEDRTSGLHIILHISDASVPGIDRCDFDGYLLRLLQGPVKTKIAEVLLGMRAGNNPTLPGKLLLKAEDEITRLMKNNGYPWSHAKSWLYAYITAFQFRQSHVWFAEQVVQHALDASEREVRKVFEALIRAWDLLAEEVLL